MRKQRNGRGKNAVVKAQTKAPWTFLSNHSHVLICLWREPEIRLRDVAAVVGITERAVQAIVADLEAAGVLVRTRNGRRNRYHIHVALPLRHPVEANRTVAALLEMVGKDVVPHTGLTGTRILVG